jgi:tetratricopeptide (TPR) repeat protein
MSAMARSPLARNRRWTWAWLWLILTAAAGLGGAAAGRTSGAAANHDGRPSDFEDSLLAEYFRLLLADQDSDAFRDRVDARYSEGSLCRLLADSSGVTTRRAAVVALGSLGHFPRSNPVLGRAMRDPDPVVRRLAEDALWSIWFRADTPENNRALKQVLQLAGRGEIERAEALATRLIAVAPRFAEAYNQRAILYFEQGRFEESAQDCQRVVSLNPYHFGALSGLAQCQFRLHRPGEALDALRRVSRLQPYNMGLRDSIRRLEAELAQDQS